MLDFLNVIAKEIHDNAVNKGFWTHDNNETRDNEWGWSYLAISDKLCLIHSEISEAKECVNLDEYRETLKDTKPVGLPSELADIMIRILDLSVALNYHIGDILYYAVYEYEPADMGADYEELGTFYAQIQRELNMFTPPDKHIYLACLSEMNDKVTVLLETLRDHHYTRFGRYMGLLLASVLVFSAAIKCDLPGAIKRKMAYNYTRPIKHGRVN